VQTVRQMIDRFSGRSKLKTATEQSVHEAFQSILGTQLFTQANEWVQSHLTGLRAMPALPQPAPEAKQAAEAGAEAGAKKKRRQPDPEIKAKRAEIRAKHSRINATRLKK
jgi:hypothetical protein